MRPMTKNDLLFFLVMILIMCMLGLWVKGEIESNQEPPKPENGNITLDDDSIEFTKKPFEFN